MTTALLLALLDWLLPLSAIAATTVRRANRMSRFESDCHRFARGGKTVAIAVSRHFRRTDVTEYFAGSRGSLRLDVGVPDHLAPLLGFIGEQLAEVGR